MKIEFARWRTYHTPHFTFVPDHQYWQLSFVVWNFHWWVIVKRDKERKKAFRDFFLLILMCFGAWEIIKYVIINS